MPTIRFASTIHESPFHGGVRYALMRILNTGIAVFLAILIVSGLVADSLTSGISAVLILTFLNDPAALLFLLACH